MIHHHGFFHLRARQNPYPAAEDGAADDGILHDAAFPQQAVFDCADDHARRRPAVRRGVNGPLRVGQIEFGSAAEQIHVRLPVGLDRPDVTP
ncbi:MAG: hypothetical protein E6G98_04835, partial [Bacillati bacterium ANGP1]